MLNKFTGLGGLALIASAVMIGLAMGSAPARVHATGESTPTATAACNATPTLQAGSIQSLQVAPPTCTPVTGIKSATPTGTASVAATSTSVPATQAPASTPTTAPAPSTATSPAGGAGAGVTGPNTGTGDGTTASNSASWFVSVAIALAVVGGAVGVYGLRRKV